MPPTSSISPSTAVDPRKSSSQMGDRARWLRVRTAMREGGQGKFPMVHAMYVLRGSGEAVCLPQVSNQEAPVLPELVASLGLDAALAVRQRAAQEVVIVLLHLAQEARRLLPIEVQA